MAWNYTPADAAEDGMLNTVPFLIQFWHALRERAMGAGAETFAPQAHAYETGTITAVTDDGTTFTVEDDTKSWTTSPFHRWIDPTPGSGGIPAWAYASYDLVIDCPFSLHEPDPRKVIQAPITAQPSATEITCTMRLADRIAERVINAASDLVGRRYWIIRRNGDNWTRGYPDQPNDGHYATGLVESCAAGTLTSQTAIQNAADIAAAGAADVLYVGENGRLQRGTLTAAVGRVLTYAGTSSPPVVVGARFYVVVLGGVWRWDADGDNVQAAYGGLMTTGYCGHDIDDSVGTASFPALTYPVSYAADPLLCPASPVSEVVRDYDYYIGYDNACGPGDIYIQPNIYKVIRGVWTGLMRVCPFYVKPIDWTGAAAIPNFSVATWWHYAGINGTSGTTGTHSGTSSIPCAMSVPHTPVNLWWSILDDAGNVIRYGYEEAYDGSTLNNPIDGDFGPTHDGQPVIASVGPTRLVPRRFGRMFDVVYFLPGDDGGGLVTPPTNTTPGTWTVRPKSTHYRICDKDGVTTDGELARHAIANGHYARYVGDNFDDPGFPVVLDPASDLKTYHNYACVGTRAEATQAAIDASTGGTAAGGSTVRIVDTSKDWLAVDYYPAFNGLTHAGTVFAGDTTSMNDPTKGDTPLWAPSRFPDFPAPLVGFTAEILLSGSGFDDPDAVIEKRIITDCSAVDGTVFWTEPLGASCEGKPYRIREPYVLNRWAGHSVTVTKAGVSATRVLAGNHDDTLFLASALPFAVDETCTYQINVPLLSGVYYRASGEWVSTGGMGDDPRNPGTNPFKDDPRDNCEDHMTEYGLPLPNDVIGFVETWQELYDAINVLTDILGPTPPWKGYADDDVPEYNSMQFDGEVVGTSRAALHDFASHLETPLKDDATAFWADQLPGSQDPNSVPGSNVHHMVDEEFATLTQIGKSYAYLEIQDLQLPEFFPMPYEAKAYVYATSSDPGVTDTPFGGGLDRRDEAYFDTSPGLLFRQFTYVGSGAPGTRIKVGGDITTMPDWGTIIDESQIYSTDHEDATLAEWNVSGGYNIAQKKVIYRMGFKFKA